MDKFRTESSNPKWNAQRNLWGRSHYADDDTLRFFRARILSCQVSEDGQRLYLIESCSGDWNHRTRVFRGVVFDINGHTLYRPELEASFKNRKQAEKALWAFVNSSVGVGVC